MEAAWPPQTLPADNLDDSAVHQTQGPQAGVEDDRRAEVVPGLPRTGARVAKRVYTNLAILDVTPCGFAVRDVVAGITLDALQARTEAKLHWT